MLPWENRELPSIEIGNRYPSVDVDEESMPHNYSSSLIALVHPRREQEKKSQMRDARKRRKTI